MQNSSLLITGGIGDFLILDYFFDLSQYKYIYLITHMENHIGSLISKFQNYQQREIISFNCKEKLGVICYHNYNEISDDPNFPHYLKSIIKFADDFSIFFKFNEIKNKLEMGNQTKFSLSITLQKISDISIFNLPDKYYFIAFDSSDKRFHCILCCQPHDSVCPVNGNKRVFVEIDWDNTLKILSKNNLKGVVVGIEPLSEKYKNSPLLIDITCKTNILESFEILKNAIGYIGIDSCFSVIASKLFEKNNIFIKSIHSHSINWKNVYFHNKNFTVDLFENITT